MEKEIWKNNTRDELPGECCATETHKGHQKRINELIKQHSLALLGRWAEAATGGAKWAQFAAHKDD